MVSKQTFKEESNMIPGT